jgi:hypothetical protein
VCQQGTRLTKLKITTKESSIESVRQIIRQKPAKASGVRQPKKVDRKMIGMGDALFFSPICAIWPANLIQLVLIILITPGEG